MNDLAAYEYVMKDEIARISDIQKTINIKVNQGTVYLEGTQLDVTIIHNAGKVEVRGMRCSIKILSGNHQVINCGFNTKIEPYFESPPPMPPIPSKKDIEARRAAYARTPNAIKECYEWAPESENAKMQPPKKLFAQPIPFSSQTPLIPAEETGPAGVKGSNAGAGFGLTPATGSPFAFKAMRDDDDTAAGYSVVKNPPSQNPGYKPPGGSTIVVRDPQNALNFFQDM